MNQAPDSVLAAVEVARKGNFYKENILWTPYYGFREGDVPKVGDAVYDEEEKAWAIRVQDKDEPFHCGFDCCGVYRHAIVVVS